MSQVATRATWEALPTGSALATLDSLAIKGRAPKTGYERSQFGQAWSDDVTVAGGHNGCDTRNDILRRDLTNIDVKPGTRGCVVLAGTLNDPYTGTAIDFQRGQGTSSAVQIDHIVALADAWQKGAQLWDAATRRNFANDPLNLQAVDGPSNQQKGAGDAATWLPANKAYRCTYVSRIVEVKATYNLSVTQAEHDAIARILTAGCPTP
nr:MULTISPECIES: HNH endonuclease family protein [Mycolicibacter]